MNSKKRQRARIVEAVGAAARRGYRIDDLGALISTLSFLSSVLRDEGDSAPAEIEDDIATLEEVYAVALDRGWVALDNEAMVLVRGATQHILASVPAEN